MTITESEIRTALQRAVDHADLGGLGDAPDVAALHGRTPVPSRSRWPRAVAVAALALAAIGVGAVLRSGTQEVRTGPASSTTEPAPTTAPTAAVVGSVPPDPASLTVLVANASGTSGQAEGLARQLAAVGYLVLPAENARDAVDPTRVYFAPGHEVAAQDLGARIGRTDPQPLPVRPLAASPADVADLVVVVGRDWEAGPLVTPDPGATYATTTTAPVSGSNPPFVLWAGTPADAAQRATPEGALRALLAAVDPDITVDDVTLAPGRRSGEQVVTARIGGTLYVAASTSLADGAWVISGLDDVDHPDLNTSALRYTDGRLVVGAPKGTVSAVVYDLDLAPVRSERYPEPGTETALDQIPDQPSIGFEFPGPGVAEVADFLLVGRDATGAFTTMHAFKIGP